MQVRDVMTPRPVTIDPEAPLETAVAVMRERRVRHLPVVDDGGRLLGIVTDRDIRSAILGPAVAEYAGATERGRLRALAGNLNDVRVSHAMTWGALTTGPAAPLAQAAAVMVDARIGSLPVVEGQRLVGILTEHDVLKALAATLPCLKGADPDDYLP
jgi:CBS-domain-containing membrane protein